MLISSRRQISDYASAAADVRLQLATTRAHAPASPVTAIERQGIKTIEELVNLGERFGHDPSGNLNFTGSTPDEIDLASELEMILPAKLQDIRGADEKVDARKWAEFAAAIFKRLESKASWDEYPPEHKRFVEVELEPFLVQLLNSPLEDKEE